MELISPMEFYPPTCIIRAFVILLHRVPAFVVAEHGVDAD